MTKGDAHCTKQDNELKKATFFFDGIAIKEKEEGGKSCAIKEKIFFFPTAKFRLPGVESIMAICLRLT